MPISAQSTTENWWRPLRFRLIFAYMIVGLVLLIASVTDHAHLLSQSETIFGSATWWQNDGMALLAGISWLITGGFLLSTAPDWSGAVEALTFLPPSLLLLFYNSHWSNVLQYSNHADVVFQLIWAPSWALLGAALIHLSLHYRPGRRGLRFSVDLLPNLLPYVPLLALLIYGWVCYFFAGAVLTHTNILFSLSYAAFGGIISLVICLQSLLRFINMPPPRCVSDPLVLWIGGISLTFCLGALPLLLIHQALLPLPMLYLLATIYPPVLWYVIRASRQVERLNAAQAQREIAYDKMQRTSIELQYGNDELQHTLSLLLHADAHQRLVLSQRIYDQPKQQALRIRSLLAHWQHKLRIEAERNGSDKVTVQPVVEALGKIRKISEELESDLRGLQMLVEDVHQRRNLGLKLHLEKLIHEDLPTLHPESLLRIQADLWALDNLRPDLEQTPEGICLAEAISYTVTQALLNVYDHAGASFATVRMVYNDDTLDIIITDDGRGFEVGDIPLEKTSLFKTQLKAREAGGTITLTSLAYPQPNHGTTISLHLPLSHNLIQKVHNSYRHRSRERETRGAVNPPVNY
ncbi:MAG TPA: hypothetical protein VH593_17370 [Ktedonobacteraceae bacterium]|jgi:hypothetical protein